MRCSRLPEYFYLWRTYGNLDALEQVEKMQEPWNFPAGTFTDQLFSRAYVWARWQESWGRSVGGESS
ncbi:MAG: hypothetical protein R2839_11500 [Thermomicrobiales bacterium]